MATKSESERAGLIIVTFSTLHKFAGNRLTSDAVMTTRTCILGNSIGYYESSRLHSQVARREIIVAKMPADAPEDEPVEIEWSGAIDRLGPIVSGKHDLGFLQWYLQARAHQLQAELELRFKTSQPVAEIDGVSPILRLKRRCK